MLNPDFILWGWLLVCLAVFKRKAASWGIAKTTSFLLLAGTLLLPAQHHIKPPGLAYLDKHAFTILGPWFAIRLFHADFWRQRSRAAGGGWLVVIMALALAGTVATNTEPIDEGATHMPPLGPADFRVELCMLLVYFYLPWSLGQRVYRTPEELRTLMVTVVGSLVIYWAPILLEVRFSPQLHNWLYGYHPFSFAQAMRSGGFRPSVLFNHGLMLAMFQVSAVIMALALYKNRIRIGRFSGLLVFWVGLGVLVLCKSKGALVYTMILAPAVYFLKPRGQLVLACSLASVTLLYPMLRAHHLVPDDEIVQFATEKFGKERAESLEFRFRNESALFDRAWEKPWFGWGGGNRSLISDPLTGTVVSIPDGEWILHLGMFGVFGYYTRFGLYVLGLWSWLRNRSRLAPDVANLVSALGLVVAVFVIDQLPNSTSNRLPLVYAAAIYSLCRTIPSQRSLAHGAQRQGEAVVRRPQPAAAAALTGAAAPAPHQSPHRS